MTLNKQGPEKIEWTDYTWNPISGCKHNCDYCYMKRLENRFKNNVMHPALHPSRYDDIVGLTKPSNIFTGSSGDMWGEWVPASWINIVLGIVEKHPQHLFQFLTKNPKRYAEFDLPENGIYGTSMDGLTKTFDNFIHLLNSVQNDRKVFVSFEPLKNRLPLSLILNDFEFLNWVIIGADSNPGARKPPLHWAGMLIGAAQEFGVPVFVKDNYNYPEKFKEMPKL